MEPWKPPVPFSPYQVPLPLTTTTNTTAAPGMPDYNLNMSRTPDTSQIQPLPATASSWLHTWDCGKVIAAHDTPAPHLSAAPPSGTQHTNPARLHTSTGSVQYLTDSSPWICAWSPLLLLPSVNPSPNTPAQPSRYPNGTAREGGAVECLSVQPGVKTDHREHLGINAEI
ncbi:hypothetical protein E2C01_095429 [Portunus trituberculatus]|uniref:Uncharacterized protein n=1 Tax=Portunus trituberculatus TaxID=210409 RepID=A0A5B7JV86_PORTR|nr:hypothetical protein [Portunus trituberculatus]